MVVIWVEDRRDTIIEGIRICKDNSLKVVLCEKPHSLLERLREYKGQISLIVLDIMLDGVHNLDSIGIRDASTDDGYNAGWVILDRLLRPEEADIQQYRMEPPDSGIPILLISAISKKTKDTSKMQEIRDRYPNGGFVKYIEKGGLDEKGMIVWTKQFEEIIKEIA